MVMVKKYSLTIFWALLACIGVNAQSFDGYYSIKNNGNGKYVDVKGRRTVVFTPSTGIANAAGTVIKLKTTSTEKGTAVTSLRPARLRQPWYEICHGDGATRH